MTLNFSSWHSAWLPTPFLISSGVMISATMSYWMLMFKPAFSSFKVERPSRLWVTRSANYVIAQGAPRFFHR